MIRQNRTTESWMRKEVLACVPNMESLLLLRGSTATVLLEFVPACRSRPQLIAVHLFEWLPPWSVRSAS